MSALNPNEQERFDSLYYQNKGFQWNTAFQLQMDKIPSPQIQIQPDESYINKLSKIFKKQENASGLEEFKVHYIFKNYFIIAIRNQILLYSLAITHQESFNSPMMKPVQPKMSFFLKISCKIPFSIGHIFFPQKDIVDNNDSIPIFVKSENKKQGLLLWIAPESRKIILKLKHFVFSDYQIHSILFKSLEKIYLISGEIRNKQDLKGELDCESFKRSVLEDSFMKTLKNNLLGGIFRKPEPRIFLQSIKIQKQHVIIGQKFMLVQLPNVHTQFNDAIALIKFNQKGIRIAEFVLFFSVYDFLRNLTFLYVAEFVETSFGIIELNKNWKYEIQKKNSLDSKNKTSNDLFDRTNRLKSFVSPQKQTYFINSKNTKKVIPKNKKIQEEQKSINTNVREQNKNPHDKIIKISIKGAQIVAKHQDDIFTHLSIYAVPNIIKQSEQQKYQMFYCLKTVDEIIVIQKIFDKYQLLDSIKTALRKSDLKFIVSQNYSPVIAYYSHDNIILNQISILKGQKKCNLKMLDYIEIRKKQKGKILKSFVPYVYKQTRSLICTYIGNMGTLLIDFFNETNLLGKIVQITENDPSSIIKYKQICEKIGLEVRDYFVSLWRRAAQSMATIEIFLLNCKDPLMIITQLLEFLKLNRLNTTEILKILKAIENMLQSQLKQQITHEKLRIYIKNNFMLRKVQLVQPFYMDYFDYKQLYECSLEQLFQYSINDELFPLPPVGFKFGYAEPPPRPKILVNHIFQQFKLALLPNYQTFLKRLLQKFAFGVEIVLQRYPFLLPPFCLKIQMGIFPIIAKFQPTVSIQTIGQKTPNQQDKITQKKAWCQDITFKDYDKISRHSILQMLKPFYPTSQITNQLNLFFQSSWYQRNFYKRHSCIEYTFDQYYHLLKKLEGVNIFLNVCYEADKSYAQQKQKIFFIEAQFKQNIQQIQNDLKLSIQQKKQSKQYLEHKFRTSQAKLNCIVENVMKSMKGDKKQKQKNKYQQSNQNGDQHDHQNSHRQNGENSQKHKHQQKHQHGQQNNNYGHSGCNNHIYQFFKMHEQDSKSVQILKNMRKNQYISEQNFLKCLEKIRIFVFLEEEHILGDIHSIGELFYIQDDQLVSLLFLGNNKAKRSIFREFYQCFEPKKRFQDLMYNYLFSENCSVIEVNLLLEELSKKDHIQFQLSNQKTIQLILDGFCYRNLIEDIQSRQQLHYFDNIQCNETVLKKLIKIKEINQCIEVLALFKLTDQTVYFALHQPLNMIRIMLDRFFSLNLGLSFNNHQIIKTRNEDQQNDSKQQVLNLKRLLITELNMETLFDILVYFQSVIYPDQLAYQTIVEQYALKLIEKGKLLTLQTVLYHPKNIAKFKTGQHHKFQVQRIVNRGLNRIYQDKNYYKDGDWVQCCKSIANLQKQLTRYTVSQNAKLQLVELFRQWGTQIQPKYLQAMCQLWKQRKPRQTLIKELIEQFSDKIEWSSLKKIYMFLELATLPQQKMKKQELVQKISANHISDLCFEKLQNNKQILEFSLFICQNFKQQGKFQQLTEILAEIRQSNYFSKEEDIRYDLESFTILYFMDKPELQLCLLVEFYMNFFIKNSHMKFFYQKLQYNDGWQQMLTLAKKQKITRLLKPADSLLFSKEDCRKGYIEEVTQPKINLEAFYQMVKQTVQQQYINDKMSPKKKSSNLNQNKGNLTLFELIVCQQKDDSNDQYEPKSAYLPNLRQQEQKRVQILQIQNEYFTEKYQNYTEEQFKKLLCIITYFQLCMGLKHPKFGFLRLDVLPYNLYIIMMVIQKMKKNLETYREQSQFYGINIVNIYDCYLQGLFNYISIVFGQKQKVDIRNQEHKRAFLEKITKVLVKIEEAPPLLQKMRNSVQIARSTIKKIQEKRAKEVKINSVRGQQLLLSLRKKQKKKKHLKNKKIYFQQAQQQEKISSYKNFMDIYQQIQYKNPQKQALDLFQLALQKVPEKESPITKKKYPKLVLQSKQQSKSKQDPQKK